MPANAMKRPSTSPASPSKVIKVEGSLLCLIAVQNGVLPRSRLKAFKAVYINKPKKINEIRSMISFQETLPSNPGFLNHTKPTKKKKQPPTKKKKSDTI